MRTRRKTPPGTPPPPTHLLEMHFYYQLSPLLTLSQRTHGSGVSKGQRQCACRVHVHQFAGDVSPFISFYANGTLEFPTASTHVAFSRASCGWRDCPDPRRRSHRPCCARAPHRSTPTRLHEAYRTRGSAK